MNSIYPKPIFIVSTGRSGSKMLATVLSVNSKVLSLHEPYPQLNTEAFNIWENHKNYSSVKKSVERKRTSIIEQITNNGLRYVESSSYCSHLIPVLVDLYDAKFIHLYRDGRDFLRSGLERDTWYNENHDYKYELEKKFRKIIRRKYLIDTGMTWEDHKLEPPKKYKTRIEKISWLWVEINKVILNHFANLKKDKSISIKLEDFDTDSIKQLYDFLKINYNKSEFNKMLEIAFTKPNSTKERKVSNFKSWKPDDQEMFWEIAGGMMSKLKYDG